MFQANKSISNKGFTITEVLIVIVVLSLLMVPLFRVMGITYETINGEKEMQMKRESFRFFTSYLLQDLLFAHSVQVQNESDYDVLSYTNRNGEQETIYFGEEGISFINKDNTREKLTSGERYEYGRPMVTYKDGVVRFNYYAREVNSLLITSIKPRTIGGD